MLTLKHRTASGILDTCWEFCPERMLVLCVLKGAPFDVPVCVESKPKAGAFVLTRLTEDVWRVAPSCFELQRTQWITHARHYPDTHVDEFIALTHAPKKIQRELEAL